MGDLQALEDRLAELFYQVTNTHIENYNENVLAHKYNVSSVDLAYFVLRLSHEFQIQLTPEFVEAIRNTTIRNIAACIRQVKEKIA